MEALRDRLVRIDVPYLLKWQDEVAALESMDVIRVVRPKGKKYRSIDDPWEV